jgi:tetratricopeptide (TPR) repeat protein
MLALRADLSVDVARHTEGDPLFATQLLRDWVDRDLLRSGEKGYELRSEEGDSSERPRFPDDLDALWDQRLQAAFESLDGADIDECFRAVEIAAVLGRRIDREEWNAACAVAEIAECDGIENAMLERGLAESADDGGCFFHSKLVSSLRQRARDQGRWADHNRRCAQALARVLPRRRDALLRRAEHLLEAGDREAALDPLYDAAVNCGATGRYREDNRLLEKRAALMDELGIPEDDRRRVQNRIGIASNLKHLGEAERAKEYLREAEDYCRENGWEAGLAEVLRILGSLYAEASGLI